MSPYIRKCTVASLIALVLVYYSAAWAVLRCPHEQEFANTTAVVSDSGVRDPAFQQFVDRQADPHLDCMGSDYHTEILAGGSAAVELRLSKNDVASHSTVMDSLRNVEKEDVRNLWLNALFDAGSALSHPTDLPRSLSVLRL